MSGLVPGLLQSPSAMAATAQAAPAVTMSSLPYQSPDTPDPSSAGATTPFTTYQAPEAALGGGASVVSLTSAPTTEYDSPQGEASGHAYVQLTGPGQSLQWTNQTGAPINYVNIRASIPDSSNGTGMTATLDLYVNGVFRQAINMNSIQSWEYEGGSNNYNQSDENPADGDPRAFWDDFNAPISGAAIPAGATFSLQKDSSNSASFYWINSIDLWDSAGPAAQPANSISITSCGAVADNTPTNGAAAPGAQDSTADIQNCANQAAAAGEILWIPQGTFYLVGTSSIVLNNVTVEGAGYLSSEIYRDVPLPNNTPLGSAFQCYSCHLENLHIDSDALSRAEVDGGGGAEDTTGTNWVLSGLWVQHVESSVWASGSGGMVENDFFTDIFADGCNLNNVSLTGTSGSNLTATNNYIRGTGDDGMAINSVAYNGSTTYTAMTNITMTHNTVIAAWGGKGIGVYGGSGHTVDNNYLADTARYIGLGVGRFGVNGSDMTGATVSNNVVVRSGGNAYNQGQPAMHIGNGGDGQNVGIVSNATVTNNTVYQSVYDGIAFSTSTGTNLSGNSVINPWRNGIVISPPFYPAPTGNASITGNTVTGLASGMTAYANDSSGFTATLSNNSWQGGTTNPEGPYGGTPAAVPGTVLASNYDTGGQGVAYNVNSINGTGNSYRSDGVDLEATSDTGGGYDLGWTSTGQWFRYTVNVATAGSYTVSFRVASPSGVTDAFHLASATGTALTGSENIPATGGWQTWTTTTDTVTLPAGQQTLVVDQDNGGWNSNYLSFAAASGSPKATLSASPATVAFGNHTTGTTSAAQSVTISNTGTAAAAISSVGTAAPFAQTNTCGSSLAAGSSCTVSVTFAPTAVQAYSGNLTVSSNATDSTLTVALSGSGVATATATLTASPTSVSFGNQATGTTSAAQSVTISNTGNAAASISSISTGSPFAETNTCGSSLAAGSSCTVSATFAPSAAQTYGGTLTVSSNASNSTLTIALSGTGTSSSGSTNLALNAPVTASSSNSGYPASNAVDGNTSSYWEGTNGVWPTTLSVNLGAVHPITSVVIDLPPATAWSTRTQTLSVLGSTNNSTWTTLVSSATYTWNPSTGNTVTITLPSGSSEQYVELSFTANNVQNGAQASEFQVWGTGSAALPDLALNAPVTASSTTSGYPASNAVDGNTSSYWEGTNGVWPTTLSVNLGSSQTLGYVVVDLPPATAWSTRTQTLSVLGSTNNSTWTTLVSSATYTWNPSTGNTVTINLPAGTTDQYLELSFTANNVQNGAQVSELYVYS